MPDQFYFAGDPREISGNEGKMVKRKGRKETRVTTDLR